MSLLNTKYLHDSSLAYSCSVSCIKGILSALNVEGLLHMHWKQACF